MSDTHSVGKSPQEGAAEQATPDPADGWGAGADTSPTVRIRSLLPGLAKAEQRVANVILDDASAVSQRSITEVAHAAKTSETTVTRFCKAIGVSGYPALRIALAADVARTRARPAPDAGNEIAPNDNVATLVSKLSYADARSIEDTAEQLDANELEHAIDALAKARRIDIYGVGASAFVAADLQQKLHRIGRVSFAWSDAHVMLSSAAVLCGDDVALGLSHTGTTTDTVDALRLAGTQGACTIALTNFPQAPISAVADTVLTTAARETAFRSGEAASRIAALTIVDCLFVGVAQRNMTDAASSLDAAREAAGSHRLSVRQDGRRRHQPTPR